MSDFHAQYEGQGFYSLRNGWPDYVTMSNGVDVLSGGYESRDYFSAEYLSAMQSRYEQMMQMACMEIVDSSGTCPYDEYSLTEWESWCEEHCDAYIDMKKCWMRYFQQKVVEL